MDPFFPSVFDTVNWANTSIDTVVLNNTNRQKTVFLY